ncbi:MAG: hypothetical protein LBU81_08475 [Methanosarcinales archaeon]|nr:hypothetical protein [Methanosarcinales archaeon]
MTENQTDEEEQTLVSREFRLAQIAGGSDLRFSYSEDTAIEKWSLEMKPEELIDYEDIGPIIPESPKFNGSTSGTHLWEFDRYGKGSGIVELDFKLRNVSDNSIKEQFIYHLNVGENNRTIKMIAARQLETSDNPLETGLKIEENKTADMTFHESVEPAEKWTLETVEYGGKLNTANENISISETDDIPIHNWKFEGEKQGSVRLTYQAEISENAVKEIHYDMYVNEDMTIEIVNVEYNTYRFD